jgi:hypothetical protein
MAYELKRVQTGKAFKERPEIQIFEDHSPLLVGLQVYLMNRKDDGKALITSRVTELDMVHENIWRFTTSSGSVYELRKV